MATEGGGERPERIPVPQEDPVVLDERKLDLIARMEALKQEHPESMGDAYYKMMLEDVQKSPDKFALAGLESSFDVIEAQYPSAGIKTEGPLPEVPSKVEEVPPEQGETEFIGVSKDDNPAQSKVFEYYVHDESADPSSSFIEEGTGKRLRLVNEEESKQILQTRHTRPYQKENTNKMDIKDSKVQPAPENRSPAPEKKPEKKKPYNPKNEPPVNPRAKGIYFDSDERARFVRNGDAIGVRQEGKTRLATEDEIAGFYSLGEPEWKANHDIGTLKKRLDERNALKGPDSEPRPDKAAIALDHILRHANPEHFGIVQNTEWTGRDGELQRWYETPALPGVRVTEEQYQWMRNGRQGPPPPSAEASREERDEDGGGSEVPAVQQRQSSENSPSSISARGLVPPKPSLMGVVPRFLRRYDSRRTIGAGRSLVLGEHEHTMDVILEDKKKQELFGELVKAHGPRDLFERFMKSSSDPDSMSESDYAELQNLLREFDHRSQLLEEAQKSLTTEDVQFMLEYDPAFRMLSTTIRPARRLEIMKGALAYQFMRGTHGDINAIILSQRSNSDIRLSKQYMRLNDRVRHHTGRIGVGPENLNWHSMDTKLARQIRRPGFFASISPLGRETSKRSLRIIDAMATNRLAIGRLLAGTISQDRALVSRIALEAQSGERAPGVGERGVSSYKAALAEQKKLDESLDTASLLRSARDPATRETLRPNGKSWKDATPQEREDAFFDAAERQNAQMQQPLGWFSRFLSALFSVRLKDARKQLRDEGVFTK